MPNKSSQIFSKFKKMSNTVSNKKIAMGLGPNLERNQEIFNWACVTVKKKKSDLYLVGTPKVIHSLSNSKKSKQIPQNLHLLGNENPSNYLISNLKKCKVDPNSQNKEGFDAIIRGSLGSSDFLKDLRQLVVQKHKPFQRLALLSTAKQHDFFFAGVGIDEIETVEAKSHFIKNIILFAHFLKITPNISILSGGRLNDVGRNHQVDSTLKNAKELVNYWQEKMGNNGQISHDEILIEKACEKERNFIIPPNGISGNLIYRTLIHLGNGRSYGAIYLEQFLDNNYIIIDCSRVAPDFELSGSLFFALRLLYNQ